MTRVSTTLSADASQYIRELQKTNAELEKMRGVLQKVADASQKAQSDSSKMGQEQEGIAGKMAASVTQWAAGLVSVSAAYRVITNEMRNQLEMQTKMAAAQNTVAAAEQRLAMNAANPREFQQLRSMAQRVSQQTGVPMQAAIDAAGAANSAKGGAGLDAVESAMRVAARAMPNNVSEIPAVTASLLDARVITGTTNAEENYAKLAAVQADSRPVSLATTARYLLPSAKGAQSILPAENRFDWLATAGMMTGAAIDPSGEKTAGATQVIAGKMKDFFDNPMAFEMPGGGYDKGAKLLNWYIMQQATGGMRPEAGRARRFLQNEPYWRELFLGDAKLGVRAIPGAAAMFDPAYEQQIQRGIGNIESATAEQGMRQISEMENTPANRTARVSRIAQSATEFAQLSKPTSAQIGAIRGQINDIEQALGYSGLYRLHEEGPTAAQGFLFGEDAQVDYLRGRVQRALQTSRQRGGGGELEAQLQRLITSLDGMAAALNASNRQPTNVGPPEIK